MADDAAAERARMVERQLAARGIGNPAVLAAMGAIPREEFVPPALRHEAYADGPLPIGCGQTISQPYIVALMAETAGPPLGRVLDIGTGSGYAAAVMARLAREVFSVERHPPLAEAARERLARLGILNVHVRAGDGMLGWPEEAPFDAILCAAAAQEIPAAWRSQLAVGGRLVLPVGPAHGAQELRVLTRTGPDSWADRTLGAVAFVPLTAGLPGPA
ncbi:protein-L-isoaspartate(D-aspartate) O-methyltransferase [Arenibaculum pallidiluteum]|uniref:protein-L-isoaspartate(D-aspartate) O-methyltransferase n=1 Tax=Arenibaculum pallidiluteum TaxID=2812559 RepID=UPI001A95CC5A|nr:protein-L-isoaspartate(D-aspartate) O-methyltransferase [Arenibaculum pallidiluteum]